MPVAGYRVVGAEENLASVHLFLKNAKSRGLIYKIRDFINSVRGRDNIIENGKAYGTDINFLMFLITYSHYEKNQRHVLRQKISKTEMRSLVDLGSAFLMGSFWIPAVEELPLSSSSKKYFRSNRQFTI